MLRLNRPDQLNPIDTDTLAVLDALLDRVEADETVRAVLVTGRGRAFSAGGDLKKYRQLQRDAVAFPRFVADLHRVFGRLRHGPVPVIALVNGVTAAGGLELLLNCDFALAARSARIGDGHLNFGQMGGGGVLTLLPRAVGRARAAELIYSGRFLDAAEAAAWGLVNRVVDDDLLEAEGLALAEGMATKSRLALANAKDILHTVWAERGQRRQRPPPRAGTRRLLLPDLGGRARGVGRLRGEATAEVHRPVTVLPDRPEPDEDSAFFWDGLRRHRLLVQRCPACGRHRFPPMPSCPACGAERGDPVAVSGLGRVYSWVRVHRAFDDAHDVRRARTPSPWSSSTRAAGCSAASSRPGRRRPATAVGAVFADHDDWTELRWRPVSEGER